MSDEIIRQMEELTGRVKTANEPRTAFVHERAQIVAVIIAKIGELKLTNVSNGTEIEQLKRQLEENQSQLEKIQKDVAEHTTGGETLRKQIVELKAQIEEKDKELTEVKAKLAESAQSLGMSISEKERLQKDADDLRSKLYEDNKELSNLRESQIKQNELSKELEQKIVKIENDLQIKYTVLKSEVEKLLTFVDADDTEQRKLLRSILAELGEKEQASKYTDDEQLIINELNRRVDEYFIKNDSEEYIMKDDKRSEFNQLGQLKMPLKLISKIQKNEGDLSKKYKAYNKYNGITRVSTGGRRKRVTQKKRPRNKKVTRKLIKRRRTQKKRRPIKKRRTARK